MSTLIDEEITEIGIDQDGKVYLRPREQTFRYIYRAAMEVNWDSVRGVLYGAKPREWSHFDWFHQILAAAASEDGVRLRVNAQTKWSGVSDVLRSEIEKEQARTQ